MALRRRLERLAPRDPERSRLLADTARLYDVSRATLYLDLPPTSGGMRSERHAAACMAIPSMPARASAGVR